VVVEWASEGCRSGEWSWWLNGWARALHGHTLDEDEDSLGNVEVPSVLS